MATKQSIQAEFPECKEIQTLSVDFSNADIYDQIQSKLKNLRIDVLVNNVGISYPFADYFTKIRYVLSLGDALYSSLSVSEG